MKAVTAPFSTMILAALLAGNGCVTTPSAPGSPSSPSPSPSPSTSPGSSPSSPAGSDAPNQGEQSQGSGTPRQTAGRNSGASQQPGGQPAGRDGSTTGTATGQADGSTPAKTEDEVLSEAMEVFEEGGRDNRAGASDSGTANKGSQPASAASGDKTGGGAGNGPRSTQAGYDDTGGAGTAPSGQRGGGPKTDAEKVGSLDRQLDEELAQFDGIILERRAQVIEQENREGGGTGQGRRRTAGTTTGGRYPGDEGGESAPLLTATAEDPGNVATRGNRPDMAGDQREGDYKREDTPKNRDERIPEDIPDGDDDDIVARQLREAAMAEDDPELREKLWDEYRKYKRSTQAQR